MANIQRGKGLNKQVDERLKVQTQFELPSKDNLSTDEAGSLALKSNNNLHYKDNLSNEVEIAKSSDLSGKQDIIPLVDKNNYRFDGYALFKDTAGVNVAGSFVRINSTNILYQYRHSNVYTEIDNDGAIWGVMSTDNGQTWGTPYQIYSDSYDDRNSIIGKSPDGGIVIVFRRYDATTGTQIDAGSIKSFDGIVWSAYTVIPSITNNGAPFGDILVRGSNMVFVYYYSTNSPILSVALLYESTDNGLTWSIKSTIYNSSTIKMNEPFLIDLPNGKSIVYARNEERIPNPAVPNVSIYQFNSDDGVNFSAGVATNINDDINISTYSPVFPFLDGNNLIIMAPQRNGATGTFGASQESTKLSIYINNFNDVFGSPTAYTRKHLLNRPYRNISTFYGYPGVIKLNDNKWVGIIGDLRRNDSTYAITGTNEKRSLYIFDFNKLISSTEVLYKDSKYAFTKVTKNSLNGGQDYVTDFNESYSINGTVNYLAVFGAGGNVLRTGVIRDDAVSASIGAAPTTARFYINHSDATGATPILRLANNAVTSRSYGFHQIGNDFSLRDQLSVADRMIWRNTGVVAIPNLVGASGFPVFADASGNLSVTGTVPVSKGGTGLATYTAGNYVNALNSTTLQQRTPSQVLSDIGASPSTGGSGYIQNQTASAQVANFNITGKGIIGTAPTNPTDIVRKTELDVLDAISVKTTGDQTVNGNKLFTSLIQTPAVYFTSIPGRTNTLDIENISGQDVLTWQKNAGGNGQMRLRMPNDGVVRTYDLPTNDGTLALTSDLANYVALSGNQSIAGIKRFTTGLIAQAGTQTTLFGPSSVTVSSPDGLTSWSVNQPAEAGTYALTSERQSGWAQYTDNVYTSGSPLVITSGATTTITNNAATSIVTQLPDGVSSLYNSGTSKITPASDGDSYLINVRFTAVSSSTSGLADVAIDIGGAMNIISQETISLRKGIGNSQRINIIFDVFSGATFIANGGLIKLTSIDGDTSIYDISYKITRTHKAK